MITREDIRTALEYCYDNSRCFVTDAQVDAAYKLFNSHLEQYQALVEAAVDLVQKWHYGSHQIEWMSFEKTVKPFIKPSPSERLEELAIKHNTTGSTIYVDLREIAAAVREIEK